MQTSPVRVFRLALALALAGLPTAATHAAKEPRPLSQEAIRNSTLDKLSRDLKEIDSADVTARIRHLETMLPLDSAPDSPTRRELDELQKRRAEILDTLKACGSQSVSLAQGFKRLAPFAKTFQADPRLRQELRYSLFANRLTLETRKQSSTGNAQALEQVREEMRKSGLQALFAEPFQEAVTSGLATRVDELLAAQSDAPSDSKLALVSALLLGGETDRLSLGLQIEDNEAKLANLIQNSLSRRWERQFDWAFIETSESGAARTFDIEARLTIGQFAETTSDSVEEQISVVPGLAVVKENPAFKRALYLYESADQIYETELEQYYQYDHAEYLDELKEVRAQATRSVLDEDSNNPGYIAPPSEYPDAGPNYGAIQDAGDLNKIEFEAQKLARLRNIKHPEPPEPPHERLLKNLQETPSTLRVQEEDQPYTYRRLTRSVEFSQSAEIVLETATEPAALVRQNPTLTHSNSWFENEGANPRDHSVEPGNFSPSAVQSAQRLFQLKFSADCVKTLETALDGLAAKLWNLAEQTQEPSNAELAAAIKLSTTPTSQRRLTLDEALELSRSLAAPNLSQADARRILLALALKKTGWTDKSPTLDQLAAN